MSGKPFREFIIDALVRASESVDVAGAPERSEPGLAKVKRKSKEVKVGT